MKRSIKHLVLTIAAVLSIAACQGNRAPKEDGPAAKAVEVAAAAKDALSLSEDQTASLAKALSAFYAESPAATDGMDLTRLADVKNAASEALRQSIEAGFSKEKAAEIIAWYYNYSNRTTE